MLVTLGWLICGDRCPTLCPLRCHWTPWQRQECRIWDESKHQIQAMGKISIDGAQLIILSNFTASAFATFSNSARRCPRQDHDAVVKARTEQTSLGTLGFVGIYFNALILLIALFTCAGRTRKLSTSRLCRVGHTCYPALET
jgi:hypothetical protein